MLDLNDLQRYLAREFADEYLSGRMSRRDLFKRILGITGSIAAASSLLIQLGCGPAAAPVPTATPPTPTAASGTSASSSKLSVPESEPAVSAGDVSFAGNNTTLKGYLARPKAQGVYSAVLVCHENRGLVDHIRDVARRLAKAGHVALALDLLSREGGTAAVDPGQVPGKLSANPEQAVADFQAAFGHLQSLDYVRKDRIGMIGFCFGGGITWRVATAVPELKAAVPFYGPNPPLADVPKIGAAVLAIYGEQDQRINASIPDIESAMKQHNKTFEKEIYAGAGHAFYNDTGANWNEQAAEAAWQRTLDWLKRHFG